MRNLNIQIYMIIQFFKNISFSYFFFDSIPQIKNTYNIVIYKQYNYNYQILNNQTKKMSIWTDNIIFILSIITLCLIPSTIAQQTYKFFIFTPKCYSSLVEQLNIKDIDCIKLTVSKLMGYGLVVGGAIVKIPQVIKILIDKSVYGISFFSVLMQSCTNWVTIVYSWYRGNPFSIYGENVFILAQNLLIMFLFLVFGRNVPKQVAKPSSNVVTRYGAILGFFCLSMFLTQNPHTWPPAFINYSMIIQIMLFSTARLTQIIHIYRCKSTGSLALITCLLVFLGNLGRLFTVFVEIKEDYMFGLSILLASILNGIILAQFFIYWNNNSSNKNKEIKQKSQ